MDIIDVRVVATYKLHGCSLGIWSLWEGPTFVDPFRIIIKGVYSLFDNQSSHNLQSLAGPTSGTDESRLTRRSAIRKPLVVKGQ